MPCTLDILAVHDIGAVLCFARLFSDSLGKSMELKCDEHLTPAMTFQYMSVHVLTGYV